MRNALKFVTFSNCLLYLDKLAWSAVQVPDEVGGVRRRSIINRVGELEI